MVSAAAATVKLSLVSVPGFVSTAFVQTPTALAYELSTGGVTKRIPPRLAWNLGRQSRTGREVVPIPKISYLTSNGATCPPEATSASGDVTALIFAQFDSASVVRVRSSGKLVENEATMCCSPFPPFTLRNP